MDDRSSGKLRSGQASGTSMERRIRTNTASTSCPTLSLLYGGTHNTTRWIYLRQLGANDTRRNYNNSRQTATEASIEDKGRAYMAMIDTEITASNARKFGTSSSARAHISKQYTHQWYTEEFQTSSMIEYQQRVDPATTEKTRRFYTLCDVQAGRRFTKNTSNPSDENE